MKIQISLLKVPHNFDLGYTGLNQVCLPYGFQTNEAELVLWETKILLGDR